MSKNFKGLNNQQERLLEHYKIKNLLSWFAGIIDGEGWMGLNKRYGQSVIRGKIYGRRGYRPSMIITNTDRRILKRAEEIINYFDVHCYWQTHSKKHIPYWTVTGLKPMKIVLEAVMPYLVSKIDEARLVMKFIDDRYEEMKHKGITAPMNLSRQNEVYDQLKIVRSNRILRDYTLSIFQNGNDDIVHPTKNK